MNKLVYIYALVDPTNDEIRYLGKTKNTEMRLKKHITEYRNRTYKEQWIKSLKDRGLEPNLIILDEVLDSEWCFWEIWWISIMKSWGVRLTNIGKGGEGGNLTQETIEKIRKSKIGKSTRTGSSWTEEQRVKTIKSLTGRKLSNEHINKKAKSCFKSIDIEKLKIEYDKNNSYAILSEIFGLSRSKIFRTLRDNGLLDTKKRYSVQQLSGLDMCRKNKKSKEQIAKTAAALYITINLEELKKEHSNGASYDKLAQIFGVSRTKIHKELTILGLIKKRTKQ